jgi:hypothetical protein
MASGYAEGDTPSTRSSEGAPRYSEYEEPRGFGWVIYAGIMLMVAGTINFIYGIAAVAESHFYVLNSHFVVSELNTWGWVVLLIGVVQFCVAFGIWAQAQWARWTGVFIAGVSAVIQLIWLPASPFLALAVFALDLLVIYGLVNYGGRPEGT